MRNIPQEFEDLLADETQAFAGLATVMPDGTPQVTPVWFDTEGDVIRMNTARGRVKEKNLRARPYAALMIVDPDDPYRYIQIRGPLEETEIGARDHIDTLAGKYTGEADFKGYSGETRVMYRLTPESVSVMG